MANPEHLAVFKKGRTAWNRWRGRLHPDVKPDLRKLRLPRGDLSGFDLKGALLNDAVLDRVRFHDANLDGAVLSDGRADDADFTGAHLLNAVLMGTRLRRARLAGLYAPGNLFIGALMDGADMRESDFAECNFTGASLTGADMRGSGFHKGDFEEADLTGADLRGAMLRSASFVDTVVEGAQLSGAEIYGVSVWGLKGTPANDEDLVILPKEEGLVTTDDIEVAQFVYLMYDNKKIRNVLNTVTGKSVLILGRFTLPERKAVLDGLRVKLREFGLLPIVFDFDRPADRDYTETVQTLAGMSRFVIADVTAAKSTPLELEATVKHFKIPYLPILDATVDERPFAMIVDLQKSFHWVLPTIRYRGRDMLMENLKGVVDLALAKHNELQEQKAKEVTMLDIEDLTADRTRKPAATRMRTGKGKTSKPRAGAGTASRGRAVPRTR